MVVLGLKKAYFAKLGVSGNGPNVAKLIHTFRQAGTTCGAFSQLIRPRIIFS